METLLQEHFPMIKTEQEVLRVIEESKELQHIFQSWKPNQRREFLDFCSGAKGIKVTYDSFFKEIMSPEYHRERMERFLSRRRRLPLLQVVSLKNSVSVGVQSPTEIKASGGLQGCTKVFVSKADVHPATRTPRRP